MSALDILNGVSKIEPSISSKIILPIDEINGIDKLNLANFLTVLAIETPSTTIPTFFNASSLE